MTLKADAKRIKKVLDDLGTQDWVKRTERRWWPQFVFHYTDIQNAIRILESGYLYSRGYLERNKQLVVSSGSPAVLAGTSTYIKDCVRLYFRPKTPTQYYAEGIKSQTTLSESRFPDAHCPVPIFFLFDSHQILADKDCRFSDGNLGARRHKTYSTAEELENLPWNQIYHTGRINNSQSGSRNITFHRCAEVIIPRKLSLRTLRFIYCRSEAERETLLHLLPSHLLARYKNKIVSTTRSTLFYRQHSFVEKVRLSSDIAYFHFSPDTRSPGPFSLQVDLKPSTSQQLNLQIEDFSLETAHTLRAEIPISASSYSIRLFLDQHLAYANTYEELDIPF